jgi:hypothetical protein
MAMPLGTEGEADVYVQNGDCPRGHLLHRNAHGVWSAPK